MLKLKLVVLKTRSVGRSTDRAEIYQRVLEAIPEVPSPYADRPLNLEDLGRLALDQAQESR